MKLFEKLLFGVVGASAVAVVWYSLVKDGSRLDSAGMVAALLLAAGCAVLVVDGRSLSRLIRRVGPSGIEFQVWQDVARIETVDLPPRVECDFRDWTTQRLTGPQRWWYERGTNILFHLHHLGTDPREMSERDRARYRDLVVWVAAAALNAQEPYKALMLMKEVEGLGDLSFDETFDLALAYWLTAYDEANTQARQQGFDQSKRLFQEATRMDPSSAPAYFCLAYAQHELGSYAAAIESNRRAIEHAPNTFDIKGHWNLACAQAKLGDFADAMASLEKVPPGAETWDEIREDKDFAALKDDAVFGVRFRELYESKAAKA